MIKNKTPFSYKVVFPTCINLEVFQSKNTDWWAPSQKYVLFNWHILKFLCSFPMILLSPVICVYVSTFNNAVCNQSTDRRSDIFWSYRFFLLVFDPTFIPGFLSAHL